MTTLELLKGIKNKPILDDGNYQVSIRDLAMANEGKALKLDLVFINKDEFVKAFFINEQNFTNEKTQEEVHIPLVDRISSYSGYLAKQLNLDIEDNALVHALDNELVFWISINKYTSKTGRVNFNFNILDTKPETKEELAEKLAQQQAELDQSLAEIKL